MSEIRVIIIDDEKMITKMLKGFLEDHGFVVETAESASEGLAILSRRGEAWCHDRHHRLRQAVPWVYLSPCGRGYEG